MTTIPGLLAPGRLSPVEDYVTNPAGLRVIGLDLSITSTGVCLPDGTTYRIKTRAKDGDRRLLHVRDDIADDLVACRPQLAVIEDLPTKMHATALKIIGKLHGVVVGALLDAEVPYAYVSPATLKRFATDKGNATKQQMADAAYLAAGAEFPGDLNAKGDGGDMCDAWWLRAAGHDWCGLPQFTMPQAQRDYLSKGDWPDAYAQRYVMGAAA
ncbi:crossover junction endodeoxyribonuclease RuvC [Streptomyces mirabilis]|uniref:crossover junction endodeoxyribonuclease RuvC n=1 Tax=Streptomyces mirabilis TaxID=68239 RepID=UPI002255268D|nr:crossover junction endodeoxyribonuclease RuvC [Streptomyces mirabilis]MCX4615741.1 crossover junction endodeoxyribonuclease RuvC [Streptomyces mirabilis]